VLTLDTWTLGWRPRDLDASYLPFLRGVGTAVPFSDPAFRPGWARPPEEDLMAAVGRWVPMFTGTALRWERLDLIRRHWDGPILVKGVQHPADAVRALEAGMDGIVCPTTAGARWTGRWVAGRAAGGGRGRRRAGAGLFRLRGAHRRGRGGGAGPGCGRGAARPAHAYGLALGGQDGVTHVLRSVLAELDLTLALGRVRRPGPAPGGPGRPHHLRAG
jgi:isopentenyl diphosphate isomerase/L-lactate dehydrogenase-like FMN-dependent dehydrogenase